MPLPTAGLTVVVCLQMSDNSIASLAAVGKNSIALLESLASTMDAEAMNEKCAETLASQAGAAEAVAYRQSQEVSQTSLLVSVSV